MQKPNLVWIIDDDRSIRWVLEKALQQSGIETDCFDTGDKALAQQSVSATHWRHDRPTTDRRGPSAGPAGPTAIPADSRPAG